MTLPEQDAQDTGSLVDLRAAMDALPAETAADEVDPAADAERFEAVHEALVAVLADVDRI